MTAPDEHVEKTTRPASLAGLVPEGAEEITPEAAIRVFNDHLVQKATTARLKYGLYIDADAILEMLEDRSVVRYPTTLHFDASAFQPHEFAYARPIGFHSSDGFALCLHPGFHGQREIWPLVIAYHIPVINYGAIVDAEAAELYGATLLGLEVEAYYQALCELADSVGAMAVGFKTDEVRRYLSFPSEGETRA